MKELTPAKAAVSSFIFLAVLYLTSALDFALAGFLVTSIIIFRLPSVWLFLSAFTIFALHLVINFLGLRLNFLSDLSISSYALFLAGLILYFWEGQKQKWQIALPFAKQINITRIDLLKLGGILIFTFLIYPITNSYLAAIIGYGAYSVVFKKFDGRYAVGVALFFLILCPFLLIAKKEKIAETSAIFTYYFLVIGVLQQFIEYLRTPQEEKLDVEIEKEVEVESIKMEKEKMIIKKEFNWGTLKLLAIFLLSTIISALSFYFLIPMVTSKEGKPLAAVLPTPTKALLPTVSPLPSAVATPTSSPSASLKIEIQNGSGVVGLAARIKDELEKLGYKNIKIGNAEKMDYESWLLYYKKDFKHEAEKLKEELGVVDISLEEKEATQAADILVIAGKSQ